MTTPAISLFTADDRCDSCGARAYFLAVMDGGNELAFCAHHGRKHRAALEKVAIFLHDESGVLVTEISNRVTVGKF